MVTLLIAYPTAPGTVKLTRKTSAFSPPRGLEPEAENGGGILKVPLIGIECRYFLGVYRKSLDLIEVGVLRA